LNHFIDLRSFIAQLKAIGDLQEIDREVDWNLEMGAIAKRSGSERKQ
jgi:UbiD family decarboxylase